MVSFSRHHVYYDSSDSLVYNVYAELSAISIGRRERANLCMAHRSIEVVYTLYNAFVNSIIITTPGK